jgi:hypothetical protein
MVLIASLMLFLGLCFECLMGPLVWSEERSFPLRGSQRSFGAYLIVEFEWVSLGSAAVSYRSFLNCGNLSIGLEVIDCEVEATVGVCNSDCRMEARRPVPVTMVVVIPKVTA